MTFVNKYLAWGAGTLALLIALVFALPGGKVRGFDVSGFSNLPILEGGRVKPLDSLARNSLLVIHSRQGFRFDGRSVQGQQKCQTVLPEQADLLDDADAGWHK